MSLFTFIIKRAVPIPKLLNYNSYAFVGAHPDDIEVGCGSTVARLTSMGKRVCFIIATDGGYGTLDPSLDKETLIKIRQEEAVKAAALLGVDDVRFLGFPDGGEYDMRRLKDKIAIELAKFKPDIIFTIDNHVKSEIHPDHIMTGRATEIAMLYSSFPLMMRDLGIEETAIPKGIAYYYTDKPNSYVKFNKQMLNMRFEALATHQSQFLCDEEMKKNFNLLKIVIRLMAKRYGIRRLYKYADAYRVLSIMHTHCLADASEF